MNTKREGLEDFYNKGYLEVNDLIEVYAKIIDNQDKIFNKILNEIPVGSITNHTPKYLPEMVKGLVEEASVKSRKLDPTKSICTKCKTNLVFVDNIGWDCACLPEELESNFWIDNTRDFNIENRRLRKIIVEIVKKLQNGSYISEDSNIEFMEQVPKEVESVIKAFKNPQDVLPTYLTNK